MMTPEIDLDLFAGPGGWSHAARALGLAEVGVELEPHTCATRHAAGHATVRADVASLPVAHLHGRIRGLIGSPPCQGFSITGLRAGLTDLDLIRQLLADLARGLDTRAALAPTVTDPRSLLVAEPLRYALAARPEWIALEQVPAVLPLWQETARHLHAAGYSTWTGLLNAADYGVPQTRKRAILIASRTRPAHRPEPTHAQTPDDAVLFGPCRKPWVTMADALGWADAPTVNARGAHLGGGTEFTAARASWALTKSARSWSLRAGSRPKAPVRPLDQPAATLLFGHHLNDVSWTGPDGDGDRLTVAQASVLQGFPPDYPWSGSRTRIFEQIGNAVPPPLASAVLALASDRIGVPA